MWEYRPVTGWFIWKVGSRTGLPVSTKTAGTYVSLMYRGFAYRAARVAWLMYYGEHARFEVDHINGEKWDNRIANLRDVPHSVNQRNQRCHRKEKRSAGASGRSFPVWHQSYEAGVFATAMAGG